MSVDVTAEWRRELPEYMSVAMDGRMSGLDRT